MLIPRLEDVFLSLFGRKLQKSRKRQKDDAEDASFVRHLRNLRKNTNDGNADESQGYIFATIVSVGSRITKELRAGGDVRRKNENPEKNDQRQTRFSEVSSSTARSVEFSGVALLQQMDLFMSSSSFAGCKKGRRTMRAFGVEISPLFLALLSLGCGGEPTQKEEGKRDRILSCTPNLRQNQATRKSLQRNGHI